MAEPLLNIFGVPPCLIGEEPYFDTEDEREDFALAMVEAMGADPFEARIESAQRAAVRRQLRWLGLARSALTAEDSEVPKQ